MKHNTILKLWAIVALMLALGAAGMPAHPAQAGDPGAEPGAALADLDPDEARFDLQVVPDGEVTTVRTRRLLDRADRWQTEFDLRVTRDDPVELRGTLKVDDRPIAETWLYQYHRRLFRDVMP